jgi:hypothetical protein
MASLAKIEDFTFLSLPMKIKRGQYNPRLKNGNVPFSHAIIRITGQTSQARALPAFKTLFRTEYAPLLKLGRPNANVASEVVERALQNNLQLWRSNGFTSQEVDHFRNFYVSMPRRSPRWTKTKQARWEKAARKEIAEFLDRGGGTKNKRRGGDAITKSREAA